MTKKEMIEKLNEDLADEFGAIIQYTVYAARATGRIGHNFPSFYWSRSPTSRLHAQFLANKIASLGATPTTAPRPVSLPEGNRAMLEAVAAAEQRAVQGYTTRAREAEAYGDKGLAVQLEDFVRDESNHLEETERILRDWPA